MAIIAKQTPPRRVIDLTGPGGNAWALLGHATTFAAQLGKDGKAITDEMKSGDYENLIAVFDREFGHVVDLAR